jgi:hypothetical protein
VEEADKAVLDAVLYATWPLDQLLVRFSDPLTPQYYRDQSPDNDSHSGHIPCAIELLGPLSTHQQASLMKGAHQCFSDWHASLSACFEANRASWTVALNSVRVPATE